MGTPRTFLVPTDFSDGSRQALTLALELAESEGAQIVLLSVFDLPVYANPAGLPESVQTDPHTTFVQGVREGLQADIDALVAAHAGGPVQVRGRVAEGLPGPTIVRVAEELDAGLIIMGTHGRSGFTRLLLGSVAERVVRTAGRPVLSVPLVPEG